MSINVQSVHERHWIVFITVVMCSCVLDTQCCASVQSQCWLCGSLLLKVFGLGVPGEQAKGVKVTGWGFRGWIGTEFESRVYHNRITWENCASWLAQAKLSLSLRWYLLAAEAPPACCCGVFLPSSGWKGNERKILFRSACLFFSHVILCRAPEKWGVARGLIYTQHFYFNAALNWETTPDVTLPARLCLHQCGLPLDQPVGGGGGAGGLWAGSPGPCSHGDKGGAGRALPDRGRGRGDGHRRHPHQLPRRETAHAPPRRLLTRPARPHLRGLQHVAWVCARVCVCVCLRESEHAFVCCAFRRCCSFISQNQDVLYFWTCIWCGLKSSVFFLVVLCWLIDWSVGCSVVLRPFSHPRLTSWPLPGARHCRKP